LPIPSPRFSPPPDRSSVAGAEKSPTGAPVGDFSGGVEEDGPPGGGPYEQI